MSALVDIESDQRVSSRGSQEKRMETVVMRRIDQAQFLSRIIPPLAVPEQKDILPFSLCRQFRQRLRKMPGDGLAVAIEPEGISIADKGTVFLKLDSWSRKSFTNSNLPPLKEKEALALLDSNVTLSAFAAGAQHSQAARQRTVMRTLFRIFAAGFNEIVHEVEIFFRYVDLVFVQQLVDLDQME